MGASWNSHKWGDAHCRATEVGRVAWENLEEADAMVTHIPQDRFAKPTAIADVAVFLAADAASMVNEQLLAVDGKYIAH